MLEVFRYDSLDHLRAALDEHVVAPAEAKLNDLVRRRAAALG
jgi:hypothetical protein